MEEIPGETLWGWAGDRLCHCWRYNRKRPPQPHCVFLFALLQERHTPAPPLSCLFPCIWGPRRLQKEREQSQADRGLNLGSHTSRGLTLESQVPPLQGSIRISDHGSTSPSHRSRHKLMEEDWLEVFLRPFERGCKCCAWPQPSLPSTVNLLCAKHRTCCISGPHLRLRERVVMRMRGPHAASDEDVSLPYSLAGGPAHRTRGVVVFGAGRVCEHQSPPCQVGSCAGLQKGWQPVATAVLQQA